MNVRSLLVAGALALIGCSSASSTPSPSTSGTDDSTDATPYPAVDPEQPTYATGETRPVSKTPWLHTSGNKILTPDNRVWMGRGLNMHDTRSCDACTGKRPNVVEIKRHVDEMVNNWNVTFIRLLLESYGSPTYTDGSGRSRTQWQTVLDDSQYLDNIREIVDYIGTKPNVYVLVSIWVDPTLNGGPSGANNNRSYGWPTDKTAVELTHLVKAFKDSPHVILAVANEPSQYVDANDPLVWQAMNKMVQTVRDVENSLQSPHHLVAVQGTQGWGRLIKYYINHPITAGNGENVVYETHPYTPEGNFQSNILTPAQTLPVIIGEFAPAATSDGVVYMSAADASALMTLAESVKIPYAAWSFHPRCGPNALLEMPATGGACSTNQPLVPTAWGTTVKNQLTSQ